MATIDVAAEHTTVKSDDGAVRAYYPNDKMYRCFIHIPTTYCVTTPGEAAPHIDRHIIGSLREVLDALDDHIMSLETWAEEQAYDAYLSTLDVEEAQDRGDDL